MTFPSSPLRSLIILGALLFASTIIGAAALFSMRHDLVVYLTLTQGAIYAAAAWVLWRRGKTLSRGESRVALLFILGVAAAMRALLIFAPPHSTDIYRYVWDGRVQAAGINPYIYVPADPALAHLRDQAIYLNINRKDYAPTIYPPMAQAVFFLVGWVSETVTAMKATMLGFEGLAVWALMRLLSTRRLPVILIGLYLWHPLAVWEIAGSGHIDIVAISFLLLSLLAAEKQGFRASGFALAAGTLTKYFPLVIAPAIYRRWDWKMPLAFVATAVALYLPYLSADGKVFGFLGGYAGEEFNAGDGLYIAALLKWAGFGNAALPVFLGLAALTLSVLALRSGFRRSLERPDLSGAFAIAVAFTVFFSPHYPWYFLWLIPFLCFFPSLSALWLTLSATALYRVGWPVGLAGMSIQYVPFAILLILEKLKGLSLKEAQDEPALA